MLKRVSLLVFVLLVSATVAHAAEGRWTSFAEDADIRYYLDQKSLLPLPDNVFIFWMRTVPKDREYIRREYNMNTLSYILTNYELDCSDATYRVRETAMFDKNRKELSKSVASDDIPYEPIQPESIVEMVQETLCPKGSTGPKIAEAPQAPAAEAQPAVPGTPAPVVPPAEPALQ
ncbi:surface-adhesin E family protein [Geomesophilobacter sediminis]|uniref:Surface-adhesin protein E-like domain-containing protein n=1 Tax=Geomesophilobacter sediminis TaxID=2798584 RepID=A0A8J7M0S0_9BACT|nr:surface-adhesin E family protein [Geomesophilobacter sediminis]MBJ6726503.1 hypothetical protein [Geomesophilobacter sediminis]